jgi:mannose-6-phosphate isomerase-like protein (cupin superfamily)
MALKGDEIVNPRTGQRMKFLLTSRDTNGELLQLDCFNLPSDVKEPEHIHPYQDNRFEIISGCLMFCIAGKERQVDAGEHISIPPKVPHYFWNGSDQEAHYIQEFRPALRSEFFFEALFGLARDGKLNEKGTANLFLMADFVPNFWNEIRVTKPPELVQSLLFGILGPVAKLLGYQGVQS